MAKTESSLNPSNRPANQATVLQVLKISLGVAILIAAGLTAYITYHATRDFVASWEMTDLPGVKINAPTTTPKVPGEVPITNAQSPLQPVSGPTPVPWDGAKRVTLLFMGLDYRDWEAGDGPPRTDSMILFSIDPINRTAAMLSIPRDLWVNIPGYNYGRINTAYQLGEAFKDTRGGGPGLAMATVQELLGIPIDYYAQIDFGAFVKFIDEIGGVKVNVPEKMTIDPLGDNNTKVLKPGVQTLPGDLALAYARDRHTQGGDFDRATRQQQVVLAIRNQILRFNMLPTLITKAPALYGELSSGIHTNLSLDEAIRLAWLASQIPEDKIKQGIIGTEQVAFAVSPDGTQQVLKPLTDKIRLLRDELFTESGPVSPVASDLSPVELMKAEGARVMILNGSSTTGLAASTADYLKAQGVNVVSADNAQSVHTLTEITFYTGKPYSVKFLKDLMKVNDIAIHYTNDPTKEADIVIILGLDWAANNPMP